MSLKEGNDWFKLPPLKGATNPNQDQRRPSLPWLNQNDSVSTLREEIKEVEEVEENNKNMSVTHFAGEETQRVDGGRVSQFCLKDISIVLEMLRSSYFGWNYSYEKSVEWYSYG